MKYSQNLEFLPEELPTYRAIVAQHFISVKVAEQGTPAAFKTAFR